VAVRVLLGMLQASTLMALDDSLHELVRAVQPCVLLLLLLYLMEQLRRCPRTVAGYSLS
jgi:hypothetical protein